jgi:hypothetical protein
MLSLNNPLCNPYNQYMLACEAEYDRLNQQVRDTMDDKGWRSHYPVVGLMYCEVATIMGRDFIRWVYNVRLMPDDPFEDVCEMADDYHAKCWRIVLRYAGQCQGEESLRKEN